MKYFYHNSGNASKNGGSESGFASLPKAVQLERCTLQYSVIVA